jgi:serine/threonine protein kinase
VVGKRVNNYEIRALIGEGGMGAVYLAEHPVLGRQVAVKVLHAVFAKDQDLVFRFFNEAKAANAIGHPNIIDVIDVGTLPDGLPYLVMELLKGENLAARIEQAGRLEAQLVIALAKQATAALEAAHEAGIVHRDLKPANLFLATDRNDSARMRLKVLDFGIAKLTGPMLGNQVKTGTGAILGTPAYMSPEQILGRSSAIDARTDIYSLGVILYHALAGEPPFVAEGFGEMMMMHMQAAPPPMRARVPAIPANLDAVVERALSKKADDRFQTMREFRVALEALGSTPAADLKRATFADDPATLVLPASLPRTVRLPSGPHPGGDGLSPGKARENAMLSTTLSSTAAEASQLFAAGLRRRHRPWLVGASLVALLVVSVGVAAVRPAGRTPLSSGHSAGKRSAPAANSSVVPAAQVAPPTGLPIEPATQEVPHEAIRDDSQAPRGQPKETSSPTTGGAVERRRFMEPNGPGRKKSHRPVTPSRQSASPVSTEGAKAEPDRPASQASLPLPGERPSAPSSAPAVREPIKF